MKLYFNVLTLSAKLPLEESQISFQFSEKSQHNFLPDELNCNLNEQLVLMSDITEMTFSSTHFVAEVENPEEPKQFVLSVLATSTSTSQVVLLGSTQIDARKLLSNQIQNGTRQTIKEPLLGGENQKGSLTFEVHTIQPQIYSSHHNLKSTESLDREQTCSSDSYEANLKDLNKSMTSDETQDFSPKFKQSLENHYCNVDYTKKIILEEIDLQDDQDEQFYEMQASKRSKNSEGRSDGIRKRVDGLKRRLIEERLKIQMDFHNLQESDIFLMRMEEKLRVFTE